jgi:hypothetical protein
MNSKTFPFISRKRTLELLLLKSNRFSIIRITPIYMLCQKVTEKGKKAFILLAISRNLANLSEKV